MVIKGKSVGHAANLARYLERDPKNQSAEIVQIRGAAARDLKGAFQEWMHVAKGTQCRLPLYSASINPQGQETLTPEQYLQAADILEQKLGLTGQPRAIIIQVNEKGREHAHAVWSRIDIDRLRAIPDSHNFRNHELASRQIERQFGLERVQGAHVERDGRERPERAPNQAEMQQGDRGIPPREVKQFITDLWQRSDSGQAFKAALEHEGWMLARGDRRDFCIVDPYANEHSLSRRIQGATAQDVRDKLKDIDRNSLPSVAEAKHIQRDRNPDLARQPENPNDRSHEPPARERAPVAQSVTKTTSQIPRAIGAAASTLTRTNAVSRSIFNAAANLLDGIASLFEALLGGGPTKPDHKTDHEAKREAERERELTEHQPTQRELNIEAATEQAQHDLACRRQDFARKYGHDVPLEPLTEHEIEYRRQRERDDRERSR